MRTIKAAVTAGKNCRGGWVTQAKQWAQELGLSYTPRLDSCSLSLMLEKLGLDALLIATARGPRIYTQEGTFFYHPGMGELRWRNLQRQTGEPDHFAAATGLSQGQRYLDCTMGLAADALIASHLVGEQGKVTALEASPLLHFVVSRGLRNYQSGTAEMDADLRRIKTYAAEAAAFLQKQPDHAFDVVYFDPMFRFPIKASSYLNPLRPLAYEKPLTVLMVQEAWRVAPRVVIKGRSADALRSLGCTEFTGGRYSRVVYGMLVR